MSNYTDACACREEDWLLWSEKAARSPEVCRNATGLDWCASLDHTSDDAILQENKAQSLGVVVQRFRASEVPEQKQYAWYDYPTRTILSLDLCRSNRKLLATHAC